MNKSIKGVLNIDTSSPSYTVDVVHALTDCLRPLPKSAATKAISDITNELPTIKRRLNDAKSPFHGHLDVDTRDRYIQALHALSKIWPEDPSRGLPDEKWLVNTSGQALSLYLAQCNRAFFNGVENDLHEWLKSLPEQYPGWALSESIIKKDLVPFLDEAIEREKADDQKADDQKSNSATGQQVTPAKFIAQPKPIVEENKENEQFGTETKKLWYMPRRAPSKPGILASIVVTPEPEMGRHVASPLSGKSPKEFEVHDDEDPFDYDNVDGDSGTGFLPVPPSPTDLKQMALESRQMLSVDGSPDHRPAKKRRISDDGVISDMNSSPNEGKTKNQFDSLDDGKYLCGAVVDMVLRAAYKPDILLVDANQLSKGGELYRFDDVTTIYVPRCYKEHWTLGVIDLERRTIELYNSLPGYTAGDDEFSEQLESFATSVTEQHDEPIRWKLTPKNTPEQSNNYDCGVYMLVYYLYRTNGMVAPKTIDPKTWRRILRTWLGGGSKTVELPWEKFTTTTTSVKRTDVKAMHAVRDSCNSAIQEYGPSWEILTKIQEQGDPDEMQNLRSKYKTDLEQLENLMMKASGTMKKAMFIDKERCQGLREMYRFRLKQLQFHGESRAHCDKALHALITSVDDALRKLHKRYVDNEKLLQSTTAPTSILVSRQTLKQCDKEEETVLDNWDRHRNELTLCHDEVDVLQKRLNTIQRHAASADEGFHHETMPTPQIDSDLIPISRQAFDQRNKDMEKVITRMTFHDEDLEVLRNECRLFLRRLETLSVRVMVDELGRIRQRREDVW